MLSSCSNAPRSCLFTLSRTRSRSTVGRRGYCHCQIESVQSWLGYKYLLRDKLDDELFNPGISSFKKEDHSVHAVSAQELQPRRLCATPAVALAGCSGKARQKVWTTVMMELNETSRHALGSLFALAVHGSHVSRRCAFMREGSISVIIHFT